MHEYGLACGIVSAITGQFPGRRVQAVAVRVGPLSGVEPFALRASWPLATAGTHLEGADLRIEEIVATVACPVCARDVEIDEFFALCCPECGTPTGDVRGARDFAVDYVDLAEEDPGTTAAAHPGTP